jgi:hypothetical protein
LNNTILNIGDVKMQSILIALPVQYVGVVGVSYKKYPNSCHIPTVPFLNVGDVLEMQGEFIIYGPACGRPITCWSTVQEIQSKLIIYGTACARPFTC